MNLFQVTGLIIMTENLSNIILEILLQFHETY